MRTKPAAFRRPLPPTDTPTPPDANRQATSADKGHGRLERRTLRTTQILTKVQDWKGLKQGFELTRERTIKGVKTVETVCGITDLPPDKANAAKLLDLTREHWAIENSLHYVRDVSLHEDACRVRKGNAPQVLAALRNTIIHLHAGSAAKSIPEAIELLQLQPAKAKKLIGIKQCE